MSADNWATCPQCVENRNKEIEKAKKKANDSYGKVSQDEFFILITRRDTLIESIITPTLREDYSLGIDLETGDFYVDYCATCIDCGFSFAYKLEGVKTNHIKGASLKLNK